MNLKTLRTLISDAQKAYHVDDSPIMSDDEYDALIDQLEKINPSDPLLARVGAKPVRGRKVLLTRSMGSLPKVRVGDKTFADWLLANGKRIVEVSDKLDGISASYGNVRGVYHLHTRGDGITGTDISHLIPHIKGMGDLKEGHEVRGELVVTNRDFARLNEKYSNPRNLAAGIANKAGIHEEAKSMTFMVHEYVHPEKSLTQAKERLRQDGFKITTFKAFTKPTTLDLQAYLEQRQKEATVAIDGVVLNGNGQRVALKAINEVATATVDHVEWNVSRHGLMKPVVVFSKPIQLAGAKVSRATAHNAAFIKRGIGPGAIVSLTRSGEVIPKILGIVHKAKPQYPPKDSYEWISDVEIRTTLGDTDDQTSLIMSHFLTVIGVKAFKAAMMIKLIEGGIDTIKKLLRATPTRFEKCGFGPKQALTLHTEIANALSKLDHSTMAAASGIFPAGFGVRRLRSIFLPLEAKLFGEAVTTAKIVKWTEVLDGIGTNTAQTFARNFELYKKFIAEIGWVPSSKKKVTKTLHGQIFVFTGIRDKALEELILSKGGRVSGSVSSNTTYVVTKAGFQSDKLTKAQSLSIPIIDIEKARKIANVNK